MQKKQVKNKLKIAIKVKRTKSGYWFETTKLKTDIDLKQKSYKRLLTWNKKVKIAIDTQKS